MEEKEEEMVGYQIKFVIQVSSLSSLLAEVPCIQTL